MDLIAAWILFPAALTAVSLGLGLLLERASGARLPGVLLVPLGFAGALALCRLFTSASATAPLALPALLLLALAGAFVGRARLRSPSLARWALLAAGAVFFISGAGVILSGTPTFGGSILLPDTSHQLALAAFLPEHGRDWQALADSAFKLNVRNYMVTAYPVGPQATLGVLAPLGVLRVAWLYQPFLSFVLALVPLCVYAVLEDALADRRSRGLVALVAGQPALVVSFALQGSIKELTTLSMVVLLATLVWLSIRDRWPARAFISMAVVSAAALGSLGPAAAAYLAPLLGLGAGAWLLRTWRADDRIRQLATAAGVVIAGLALLAPILASFRTAFTVNDATLSTTNALGHLAAPLSAKQASGVWMNGDFRYPPHGTIAKLGTLLALFVFGAAAAGVAWMWRRRLAGPLILAIPLAVTSIYLFYRGNAYADAKVMCLLAPALVMSAMLVGALLLEGGHPVVGLLVAAVVGAGVLLSNAMIYHELQSAPFHRYDELLGIGDMLEGKGPTLVTEYDEYSGYLLHKAVPWAQPQWPHGYRGDSLANPRRRPSLKTPIDLDDLTASYIERAPNIVIRRSPSVTRPPENYRRVYSGRFYEVWRREPGTRGRVVRHLALGGSVFQPGGPVPCSRVSSLASEARRVRGRLVWVPRPRLPVFAPTRFFRPGGWFDYANYPLSVVPVGPGKVVGSARLPRGRFKVWEEGSFGRAVTVQVDGRAVGSVAYQFGNPGQYLPVGSIRVRAGKHSVDLVRGGGDLRPGNGGGGDSSLRHVGPVVFSSPLNERRELRSVAPARARSLCGKWADWVEVVRPAA